MGLKVILGERDATKILSEYKYVDYNDGLFDEEYEKEWFDDPFIRKVLKEIDHIDLDKSTAVSFRNSITENIHSHKELSTGCKTLILMYKYPNVVFQARFGDNCTDLVEELAVNNDIVIKADYLHAFKLNKISEVDYINYKFKATSREDMISILYKFIEDNKDNFETLDEEELTNEELRKRHPYFYADIDAVMQEGAV